MNYIINDTTLYLKQITNNVLIKDCMQDRLYNNLKLINIISYSCLYYSSSYQGRVKGSKNLIGPTYKTPIILKENRLVVIFPIADQRSKENIWFIYNNIKTFTQISNCKVKIEFINGLIEMFNISYYSFNQQILKSSRLILIYKNRIA